MPQLYAKLCRRMNRGAATLRRGASKAVFRSPAGRLPPFDRAILEGLNRHGTVVTHIEALAGAGYTGIEDVTRFGPALFTNLEARLDKGYVVHVPPERIQETPAPILWGMNDRFIDIVEAYLGMPAAYRGLTARRDIANGEVTGTRLWHRDSEDARIVKIIVYLNDVDSQEDGPFEYIPRSALSSADGLSVFDGNRISDAEIDRVVAKDQQKLCLGRAGTVIFTDTCSVFHKGALGKRRDRYTLFYPFNSAIPLSPRDCTILFDVECFRAQVSLTPRQEKLVGNSRPFAGDS
jgi:hypothetical protein